MKPQNGAGRCYFRSRDQSVLRVTRYPAFPLPELFELLQWQVIAGEMKTSIEHGRGMPGREDKPILVWPPKVAEVIL
ncbi:MAG: hypothetical protein QGI95_01715, partial [Dehalococcoidales bacterium]|nr:hypothetical protein [Dehalococcoidales bacterium]